MLRWSKKAAHIAVLLLIVGVFATLGAMQLLSSRAAHNKGDLNGDRSVSSADLTLLLSSYSSGARGGDVNGDARTDLYDLSTMLSHYGRQVARVPYHVIFLGRGDINTLKNEYDILNRNPNVQASLREYEYEKNATGRIATWEKNGMKYYYTAAASDFAQFQGKPLYAPTTYAQEAINGIHNEGLYLHELVSFYASQDVGPGVKRWDQDPSWDSAAALIDWNQVHAYIMAAKAAGKKVVWSEPAWGWAALKRNPTFHHMMMNYWGPEAIVPTFATNFTDPVNYVPWARGGAWDVANTYRTPMGESVQSWYFTEWPPRGSRVADYNGTRALMQFGAGAGVTYFQIEGDWGDMAPNSEYIRAVNDYVAGLGATPPPINLSGDPWP